MYELDNFLDFKSYNEWIPKFKTVFDKYNHTNLINTFKNSNSFISIEDIRNEYSEDIFDEVNLFLRRNYKYVILYHGTATNDINSFLENGVMLGNIDRIVNLAKTLYPEVENERFDIVIEEFRRDKNYIKSNEGKIYFCLDDNLLKEKDSHYLLFGSETLFCLLQNVDVKLASNLKEKLKPLILKCMIEFKNLKEWDLIKLVENITVKYFENLIYSNEKFSISEFTPFITSTVSSDFILGLEFPKNIKSSHPLNYM